MTCCLRNLTIWTFVLLLAAPVAAQDPGLTGATTETPALQGHQNGAASGDYRSVIPGLLGIWAYTCTGFGDPLPSGENSEAWHEQGHFTIVRGGAPQLTVFKFTSRHPYGRRFLLDVGEQQNHHFVDLINSEDFSRTHGILQISKDGTRARLALHVPPDGSEGERPTALDPPVKRKGLVMMELRRVSSR